MKLQKRVGRKYKEKTYHKWIVTIPNEAIIDSGFKEGDKLKIDAQDGKITLIKDI